MKKQVTLKDIAERLQISQNTVSVALRGGKSVSEATRDEILQAARELGYVRKQQDKRRVLIAGTFGNISDNYFFSHLQNHALQEIAAMKAEAVHLHLHQNITRQEIERAVQNNHVSGILVIGDTSREICGHLSSVNLPVVTVGFQYNEFPFSVVNEDNFMGMQLILGHLTRKGYHNIGFIGNPQKSHSFFERYIYMQALMPTFGLSFLPGNCICDVSSDVALDSSRLHKAFSAMHRLPEAFICADDRVAVFALKILQNIGVSCPEDIALVSFDNHEMSALSTPTLTTIDTQLEKQAISAVSLLIRKIEGTLPFSEKIVIPVSLIERESVKGRSIAKNSANV